MMHKSLSIGRSDTDVIYKSHLHDMFELYLVLCDNVTVETENGIYTANRGELFIFAPFSFHKISAGGVRFERYVVSIDDSAILKYINCLDKIFFLYRRNKYTRYSLSDEDTAYLCSLFDTGAILLGSEGDNTFELAALILRVFSLLSRAESLENLSKHSTSLISDVLRYAGENAAEGISTKDICTHFKIGKTTLHNMFKDNLGITPGEYLLKYRIKLAKGYLDSGMSVTEAANHSGFNSYSHFIRIFKKKTGFTPHAYIKPENRIVW